jgi:hypothetical protein
LSEYDLFCNFDWHHHPNRECNMNMAEFIVTAGITAAVSVSATYWIANNNDTVRPCAAASLGKEGKGSGAPAEAGSEGRQVSNKSGVENHPLGLSASETGNGRPASAERRNALDADDQADASNPEQAGVSYEQFEKQKKQIDQVRQFSENHGGSSPSLVLQDRYDAEPVDYGWAAQRETELLDLFGAAEGLDYAVPESLSCKSRNCQVVVPVSGERQASSVYGAFRKAVAQNSSDSESPVVSYFSGPDNNELIMYVSRNGSSDLFDSSK